LPQVTFYTVADRYFFPGLVALLNSLRLTGNEGRVVVLDYGLLHTQRELLQGHVELCSPPAQVAENPLLSKPFPHLLSPAGVAVIIDSDMIVTDSLADVFAAAASGRLCLFSDETQDQRWFPEWQEVFQLQAPLRLARSQNSGFVALSTSHWPRLLGRWWESCCRVPVEATRARGGDWEQPFWDGDQDALNALLMSEIPEGKVAAWPQYVTDLLMDIEVVDETTLTCLYRGDPARLLHHTGGPKPWRREAWMRVQRNAYVQLLPRLLFEPDVEVRLSPSDLPLWLRPNPLGRALLRALTISNRAARYVVSHTSGRARDQVMRLRRLLAQPHDG